MLYGIVDIGSNTIRLQIYLYKNNKIKSLFSKKRTAGLIAYRENGKLNEEGIGVLISTLKKFKYMCLYGRIRETYYFATASLRNIENSEEIISLVKSELDIDIKILSSEEEAKLSFKSVKNKGLDDDDGILIDVGGGSSEIVIFENRKPVENVSLPIGSLYCYEKYVSSMLPTQEEIKEIEKRVQEEIEKSGIKKTSKDVLYGVGGTVRTTKKLIKKLNIKTEKTKIIPINLLDSLLEELSKNNKECYNKILKIKPDRIHTIVPGIIIIKSIAEYFDIKYLYVSQNSLREGVLYQLLNEEIK